MDRIMPSLDGSTLPGASATTPAAPAVFTVHGRVTCAGMPVVGITVIAFDLDVRGMQLLNRATTDTDGNYSITYGADGFTRADKDSADLVFALGDAGGKEIRQYTATDRSGQPLKTIRVRNQNPTSIGESIV